MNEHHHPYEHKSMRRKKMFVGNEAILKFNRKDETNQKSEWKEKEKKNSECLMENGYNSYMYY